MIVSAHKKRNLYVLKNKDNFYWLSTMATNRQDCWGHAYNYGSKAELRKEGYKCVRVRLEEK